MFNVSKPLLKAFKSDKKTKNTREQGLKFEELALNYLVENGLALVDRNVHFSTGELDLIMRERETLVFVEVRYRKHKRYGGAAASIGWDKQRKLVSTAQLYLKKHFKNQPPPCRFDVIAVEGETKQNIQWIKNAIG